MPMPPNYDEEILKKSPSFIDGDYPRVEDIIEEDEDDDIDLEDKEIIDTWTTKNGDVIPISQLQTPHLINCIKMVERQIDECPDMAVYTGESDYASDAVDQENRHNSDRLDYLRLTLVALKKELKEREKQDEN